MRPDIKRALIATFLARSAANAALRIVYPFLPAIARGLSVSPVALSTVVALRNLGGLATPLAARAAERKGRRWMMLVAMGAAAAGCLLTATAPILVLAAAGFVLVGLAKPAFDVSMQAWFGDRVPYNERGRVFGITELTWSVALLATVPLSGFLIELTNWRAPFVLVFVLTVVGALAIRRGITSDVPHTHVTRKLTPSPALRRVLLVAGLFSVAAEVPFIVYGQWLEGSFGLSVAGIGTFTLVIVVAELAGEGLVTIFADRWGLRRMFLGGLAVSAAAYASFALTGSSLPAAIAVVTVWIASFEITIVAAIPFTSEVDPAARERALSLLAVTISSGRAAGALVAQPLFSLGGIALTGLFSAACTLVGALLLGRVAEHDRS